MAGNHSGAGTAATEKAPDLKSRRKLRRSAPNSPMTPTEVLL